MNPGIPFDPSFLERAPEPIPDLARPLTADGLRQIVATIDLTTLAGDDDAARVLVVCRRAKATGTAAVCVYPVFVPVAQLELSGSGVRVATVAAAFPHGLSPLSTRVAEVAACRELGADEIDIVIRREHAIHGDWQALYEEVAAFRAAAGDRHLKAILAVGELGQPLTIYRAAWVAMMAGADFVKTSTGKEALNATTTFTAAMLSAVRDYREAHGVTVGLKPAGGIRTPEEAWEFICQAEAAMGDAYARPATFRLGASSLLESVQNRLVL